VQIAVDKDLYGLAIYGEPKGAIKGTRVGLGVWKGIPGLTLYDENGNERATVQTEQSGPSLRLSDVNGKGRVELSMASSDAYLSLSDKEGFMTAIGNTDLVTPRTGETHKTSAASVVLFGKDQKVLWSAP